MYSTELKAGSWTDIYIYTHTHTHVYSSIFHNSQKVTATQVSITDKWINKMCPIFTYKGRLFSLKKKGNSDTCYNMCVKSLQSYPTLHNLINCSPPGSSVHGILQARILKWVATLSSKGCSLPRDQTLSLLHWQMGSLTLVPPGKSVNTLIHHQIYFICSNIC